MVKRSAGILPYRRIAGKLEVLLVHPGGPYWKNKDLGAWSLAKGEYDESEEPLAAAVREFEEETGRVAAGPFLELAPLRQPSGKLVSAWATEMDWDPATLTSNTFSLEWPKGSGRMRNFPEVDRAQWFSVEAALRHILPGQRGFVEELAQRLERTSA